METDFEERYRTGDTPWDHGMPDTNLLDLVTRRPIPTCKALDIGCGTGDNAIWLAQQHFAVTGCDLSHTAIGKATGKASTSNVDCSFVVADFLKDRNKNVRIISHTTVSDDRNTGFFEPL